MTAREMHDLFRRGLNKLTGLRDTYLEVPEIDVLLNNAQMKYIKMMAFPEFSIRGFEVSQRSIDSIRTIVVKDRELQYVALKEEEQENRGIALYYLPDNYLYYIDARAICVNDRCQNGVECLVKIQQHEDMFQESIFDQTSILWRVVNATFDGSFYDVIGQLLTLYVRDEMLGNLDVESVYLDYIRRPAYIHNAQDYEDGQYTDLQGNVLTGSQDCELPEIAHDTIVDLAVFLAASNLNMPDAGNKLQTINI